MQTESTFLFVGVRTDINYPMLLAYTAETAAEALATCQRLNPNFRIDDWGLINDMIYYNHHGS